MNSLPLGLSIHHFVSSVGADAGFAALIAVAILVLLYFAQARETATLRTRADEAELRVQELEGQLAQVSEHVGAIPAEISVRAASPRAAAAYAAARPAAAVAAAAGVAALSRRDELPPAAPAGMGAPSLAAATRLIPDPDAAIGQPQPLTALYGGAPPDLSTVGGPAPATAAGGNGSSHRPVAAPAVARAVSGPAVGPTRTAPGGRPGGGVSRGPGIGGGRPSGTGQGRPGGPTRPQAVPPRPQAAPPRPGPRRSRGRVALGALVAALALAAVVVGVIVLTGGASKPSSSAKSSAARAALGSHRAASSLTAVQPSTVTVSVLNGTDMQGLASRVAQQLVTDGYHKGAITNFSDQTQTTSVVSYMTAAERADALAVASSLKLARAAVRQIDPNTKAIACPPSQACTSAVVVTIGKDLAAQ